jgi:hypothetical protein
VAVFDDTARFSLTPDPVTRRVGTFFQAVFHVTAPHTDLVAVDLIRSRAAAAVEAAARVRLRDGDAHRARRLPVVPRLRPRLRSEVAAQEPDGHAAGTGINDDQPVTGPVDATTGRADLKAGIRSFGTYSVAAVTVNGVAVDVSSIFGTLTVTATPGTIAGTCP